jgi:hypothetical protein
MKKIERALLSRLKNGPQDNVRLIVRVNGDMSSAATRLADLGATTLHTFNLTRSVSISCSAETALALTKEPWVRGIEEDRQVFAQ